MKNSLHWIVDFCKVCLHNGLFSYDNDTKLDMYCSRIWIREKYLGTMIAQDGTAIKTETKDKLWNQSRIESNTLKATNGTLCVDTKTIYFYTLELFVEKKNWKQSAHWWFPFLSIRKSFLENLTDKIVSLTTLNLKFSIEKKKKERWNHHILSLWNYFVHIYPFLTC